MEYKNKDLGMRLYHINRGIKPHPSPFPYIQEENEMFAKVSRTAKDVSYKLPELYSKISDRTTLKTTLEEKLKKAQNDIFENDVAIEVLVTIGLNNGIPFNTSGDLESAYDSLHPELRKIYSKYFNPEIREALKSLVYNGLVIEARFDERSVLAGSYNVDSYFNGNHSLLNKLTEFAHTKK